MMTLMINKCSKIQTNVQCYGKILRPSLEVAISVLEAVLPWRERRNSSCFLYLTSRKLPLWWLCVCWDFIAQGKFLSPGSPFTCCTPGSALCWGAQHCSWFSWCITAAFCMIPSLFPSYHLIFLWLLILFFPQENSDWEVLWKHF